VSLIASKLAGVWTKIDRAKKLLNELNSVSQEFLNGSFHQIRYEDNPSTGLRTFYLANEVPIPNEIAAIAGDVIQNLRTALDHLAFALCMAGPNGVPATARKKIYFPIADSSAKYASTRDGQLLGLPDPAATKLIDNIQPYQNGRGDVLFRLHRLNLTDKHRLLLAVISQPRVIGSNSAGFLVLRFPGIADHSESPKMPHFYELPLQSKPFLAGDPLWIRPIGSETAEDMHFFFGISVNEPEILSCRPLLPTLREMADFVAGMVPTFEGFLT